MEDYEHTNAREWDLSKGSTRMQPPEESWHVVASAKKQPKNLQKQPKQHVDRQQHGGSHRPPGQAAQKFGNQKQQKGVARSHSSPSKESQQQALPQWAQQGMKQQRAMQRRPPPKFAIGSENSGERLWRERAEAQVHIRIPIELAYQDKGHLMIAKQHHTFIFHVDMPGANTSKEFGIWGDMKAVEATLEDLRAWIEDWQSSQKSKRSGKFAKLASLTPQLQIRAENEWKKEVKKHRFRQFPPPGKGFEAIGSFRWPLNEYNPEEILGSSYEALDPIRMDCKCYVVFERERSLFLIMGRSDDVKTGVTRLRGRYLQVAARQITPLELYLLHDVGHFDSNIVLKTYDRARIVSGEASQVVKTGCSPRAENGDYGTSTMNEDTVRRLVISKLVKLHYYHGSIQMRIRLGTFLATQFMRTPSGIYTSEGYKGMVRESAFHGEVTQELGDKAVEHAALSTLQDANNLLTPQDAMTQHLEEVKPLFTAVFTFRDPTSAEMGDIRLTMIWQETTDAGSKTPTYDQVSKKWTRLDRDTETPSSILDISLSELRTGMAWQFEIHAAQSIEEGKLPTGFSEFGDSVRPEGRAACKAAGQSATDVSFMVYRPSFAHLKHLEQRLTYSYGIAGSDYTLELSHFQHRSFATREARIASAKAEFTVHESGWGLSVHRIEWDTMFMQNERLAIGEKAEWSDGEDMWFPPESSLNGEQQSGFAQMMEMLKQVKALVMKADEVDLLGGMEIG